MLMSLSCNSYYSLLTAVIPSKIADFNIILENSLKCQNQISFLSYFPRVIPVASATIL